LHETRWPGQVALFRLLLLIGCRKPARIGLDGLEWKGRRVFPASLGDGPRSANRLKR